MAKKSNKQFKNLTTNKVFLPLLAAAAVLLIAWFVLINNKQKSTFDNNDSVQNTPSAGGQTPIPSPTVTPKPGTTTKPQINGASLENIKYTLPSTWEGKISEGKNLLLTASGGGYLSISVYDYDGKTGRREFYCQVRDVCIEGTDEFSTKFEATTIGNISGYIPGPIDNSGGGTEYFGAKGNKFYVISSYNPPTPGEFDKTYKQVLDSLVF